MRPHNVNSNNVNSSSGSNNSGSNNSGSSNSGSSNSNSSSGSSNSSDKGRAPTKVDPMPCLPAGADGNRTLAMRVTGSAVTRICRPLSSAVH